jgi:hypothetical protein
MIDAIHRKDRLTLTYIITSNSCSNISSTRIPKSVVSVQIGITCVLLGTTIG